jgi:4-amino-4-deoxy-L-arabinose transferase-like glycosyltransferase
LILHLRFSHRDNHKTILLIAGTLALSAFTHLWNPVGFPALHVDEGHYMRRAMQVLEGLGPQESTSNYYLAYDHPYFGQVFLAAVFKIIGYPDSLHPQAGDKSSIEMLIFIPRVLMGMLAVLDTFLIYKITKLWYNRNVALIAALLFAVMPLSLLTRGIFLDSILLPFVLLSILFAISTRIKDGSDRKKNMRNLLILLSGIFLGIGIFTKVPIITMIPLVAFLIIKNNNKNLRNAIILFVTPVILIPIIWPSYNLLIGHFDEWSNGVLYQVSRNSPYQVLRHSLHLVAQIDPVLLILAAAGFIYLELKRDRFILLWIGPYFIFLFLIGWVVYIHWILLIPAFCIAAAAVLDAISKKVTLKIIGLNYQLVVLSVIGVFGLLSTIMLITTNLNYSYLELYSFNVSNLEENAKIDSAVTVIGSHRTRALMWIPNYVFDNSNVIFRDADDPNHDFKKLEQTKKFLLVVDSDLQARLKSKLQNDKETRIANLYYNSTETKATFIDKESDRYNFMNMAENYGFGRFVEVRTNY